MSKPETFLISQMPLSNPLREWLSQTPSSVLDVTSEVRLETTVRNHEAMEIALFDELAARRNPDLVMTPAYDGSFDAQTKLRGPYSGPRDQLWAHRAVERERWDAVAAWFDLGGVLTTEEHQPLTPLVWRRLCPPARTCETSGTESAGAESALALLGVLRERMLATGATIYRKEIVGTLRAWAQAQDEPSTESTVRHRWSMCRTWLDGLLDARPLDGATIDREDTKGLPGRAVAAIQALLIRAEQRRLHATFENPDGNRVEAVDRHPSSSRPRL